jgi:peptide/nickel transport system ATP-binding protein
MNGTQSMDDSKILQATNIKKHFSAKKNFFGKSKNIVKAVDGVSLSINKGQTFGIVGESGCGKTTLGRCLIRAIDPTSGEIKLTKNNGEEVNLESLNDSELRAYRKYFQMIFQDPYSSLNPRLTVGEIIKEALLYFDLDLKNIDDKVIEMLKIVGLEDHHFHRYAHAFSGGQRQRIGIARALIAQPDFIVCDESVSALDVSIQAQIINLLIELQKKFHLTYLFISHDLSVVKYISDYIAVMYVGKIVEQGDKKIIFENPKHPYTHALLSSVPIPDPFKKKVRTILPGEPANPTSIPLGCSFHPRCKFAKDKCKNEIPDLMKIDENHDVACHYADQIKLDKLF